MAWSDKARAAAAAARKNKAKKLEYGIAKKGLLLMSKGALKKGSKERQQVIGLMRAARKASPFGPLGMKDAAINAMRNRAVAHFKPATHKKSYSSSIPKFNQLSKLRRSS